MTTDSYRQSVGARDLVFVDPVSRQLFDYVEKLAPSEVPVLITGETGTGKELVAQHIHQLSGRKGPFLAVNCGAISDHLAESELFGHEAGSFTGASGRREGWFEAANGGTLFLDEIGDLPLALQVKLLRVLEEHEVVRIGSRKSIPVDVRLVAATNADLDHAASVGRFRSDLLYRLNIAQARVPPLRERSGDILPLARHFLAKHSQRAGTAAPELTSAAVEALLRHAWPGNIRELRNVIHFAVLISSGEAIQPEHLKVTGGWGTGTVLSSANNWSPQEDNTPIALPAHTEDDSPLEAIALHLRRSFAAPGESLFEDLERLIVTEAYQRCGGNQVQSAQLLGVTRNVIRTLLKRHGLLQEPSFRPDGGTNRRWSMHSAGM
ncbi:MAG TPA: sigma-54 dependent transcriptional regulator [Steroidobacteraceae bacterium]|nr:sigma-54 dependent transcriptional regulator [Steroidobacteraceae bacterium]